MGAHILIGDKDQSTEKKRQKGKKSKLKAKIFHQPKNRVCQSKSTFSNMKFSKTLVI